MLEEKYGPCREVILEGGWHRHASLWWKDLVKIDDFGAISWFNSEVVKRVGNGMTTGF